MSTPAELMATELTLDLAQAATVLNQRITRGAKRGAPDPRQVVALIDAGKLRVVDPDVSQSRWTVSVAEIRRYLNGAEVAA